MALPENPQHWDEPWQMAAAEKASILHAAGMEWQAAINLAVEHIRRSEAMWRQEHASWQRSQR